MKKFTGTVVSKKMNKSVVVETESFKVHPVYKKRIASTKRFLVHESMRVTEGDKVEIVETRPISKRKSFKISRVIK